jgi:hypothetical protein
MAWAVSQLGDKWGQFFAELFAWRKFGQLLLLETIDHHCI